MLVWRAIHPKCVVGLLNAVAWEEIFSIEELSRYDGAVEKAFPFSIYEKGNA